MRIEDVVSRLKHPHKQSVILVLVGICALSLFHPSSAELAEPYYSIDGKMWITGHSPAADTAFLNTGVSIAFYLITHKRFDVFGSYQLHSDAGYLSKEYRYGPGGAVDFIHQNWEQGLGIRYNSAIPIYFSFHRKCTHLLDDRGLSAPIWTTFPLGFGTLGPFQNHTTASVSKKRANHRWYVGAGPAVRSGDWTLWQNNSKVLGEGWLKFSVTEQLPQKTLQVDFYSEVYAQRTLSKPQYRYRVKTEGGVSHVLKGGEWRLYFGKLWKEDTFQWPKGRKFYYGLEFMF